MIRSVALLACVLFLGACSTTSRVHQAHAPAPGQVYAYSFTNKGGDDQAGIATLDSLIQRKLREAGLLSGAAADRKIDVVLTHYYVRSNGARFWAGIMAGRDKIISNVRILGVDGGQIGNFEVETTNTTAWGTTDGLMQKHADEIVARTLGRSASS
jgi:hypothetical protein